MRACSGVWVAHGSGSADREASDEKARLLVPPDERSYVLRRLWLSPEEEKGYYYGFSNEGLWPLCHIAHTRPLFRSEDWLQYRAVNQKFADAVCEEVDSDDPIVLVQDYHFALLPRMIRAAAAPRHRAHVLAHPLAERRAVRDLPLARRAAGGTARQQHPRLPHPVPLQQLHRRRRPAARGAHRPRAERRRPPGAVDARARLPDLDRVAERLDRSPLRPWPSAGPASSRSWAWRRTPCSASASTASTTRRGSRSDCSRWSGCSNASPELRGRFTFVQLAAPSRTAIPHYQKLSDERRPRSRPASTSASARRATAR